MPSGTKGYVFAVCGEELYFQALRRALAILRPRTGRPIYVLIDEKRNPDLDLEAELIPVDVPDHLSHHQAAIYLKTKAHRLVPGTGPHCYLDSDTVAASPQVNDVFHHFHPPVTFASDLPFPESNLRTFSPHAIDCSCSKNHEKLMLYFRRLRRFTREHLVGVDFPSLSEPGFYDGAVFDGEIRRQQWWTGTGIGHNPDGSLKYVQEYRDGCQERITYCFGNNPWRWVKAEIYEPHGEWTTTEGLSFRWVKDSRCSPGGYWLDQDGDSFRLLGPGDSDDGQETGWWYRGEERLWRRAGSKESGHWVAQNGHRALSCDHLAVALENRFDIRIRDRSWVHWNGGVFLFDPGEPDFLDEWHRSALDLIEDPAWRVRDQGALIAAVWRWGLENHPRLPREFNLMVNRHGPPESWADVVRIIDSGEARIAHLINGGVEDRDWSVWKALEKAWLREPEGGRHEPQRR